MGDLDSYYFAQMTEEVDKICKHFLISRGFSYFHFKRIYKDDSFVFLSNRPSVVKDFLKSDFTEPFYYVPTYIRQSPIYFWDEFLSPDILSLTREKNGLYHGITIMSRQKDFYDSTAFAMPEFHPSPSSYYLNILKDLQTFSELFPKMASSIIEKASHERIKISAPKQDRNRKCFFLPERSMRFKIGEGLDDYITTYEILCLQLMQDGKSYKEIGSILSMSPRTVETHLVRLKTRTGLTLGELSLQTFKISGNRKVDINLDYDNENQDSKILDLRRRKK